MKKLLLALMLPLAFTASGFAYDRYQDAIDHEAYYRDQALQNYLDDLEARFERMQRYLENCDR